MVNKTAATMLLSLFLCLSAKAQEAPPVPGWDPLPDSLFTFWRLETDQVRRLRVIEEDHSSERTRILADKRMPPAEKDRALQQLAVERRREIKAVLQLKQFEDWEKRYAPEAR
jgi:hypothetical protein